METQGCFVIGIDDFSGSNEKPISKEFYDAWVKEFSECCGGTGEAYGEIKPAQHDGEKDHTP